MAHRYPSDPPCDERLNRLRRLLSWSADSYRATEIIAGRDARFNADVRAWERIGGKR